MGVADVPPGSPIDDVGSEIDTTVSQLHGERGENRRDDAEDAKTTPPKIGEWQDFFSRVIIRTATDWYIDTVFRDVDENLLSEREIDRVKMSVEERDRIARPFAELANKLKFTRKHGRAIIAAADIPESVITLTMWFARVNRIARKYQPQRPVRGTAEHVGTGQSTPGGAPVNGDGGHAAFRIYQPGTG